VPVLVARAGAWPDRPRLSSLRKLAAACKVTVGELVGREPEEAGAWGAMSGPDGIPIKT